MMTGNRPGLYWLLCWKYLSPLAMLSILIASFVEIAVDGSGYEAWISSEGKTEKHNWPVWAILLIIFLVLVSILWIPGTAICRWDFQLLCTCDYSSICKIRPSCRLFGIVVIDDDEKAWFPSADLKEFHGIMPHEVTTAETLLFCIHPDGTEGFCCRTGPSYDDYEEEAET